MRLTFEYSQALGSGFAPQVVHMMDNSLRLIFLSNDGYVLGRDFTPELGLYSNLSYKEKGRLSSDIGVSKPSLKKIAHFGAFGFWSSELEHKFVMYMLPTDISETLLNGTITYSKDSSVSQLSISLQNVDGKLIGRTRSIISPNSKIELYFCLGSSIEVSIGKFFIDRVSIGYPEQSISVSARNAIGKLLKEQTFDVNNVFSQTNLSNNLSAILTVAQIENFFVAPTTRTWKLKFDPQGTILEGLENVISLMPNWQLAENTDGSIGIGPVTDIRFEQPSTYIFERDKTCWSYDVEIDDEETYSKICLVCKESGLRTYRDLPPHRWWVTPTNKTLYVEVPEVTTIGDLNDYADVLSAAIAIAGKIESFVGIFTPHLLIGDTIELVEPSGLRSIIGTVTSLKHTIGRGGFYTDFTVDSGGRKGKPSIKDFVGQISGTTSKTTGVVIS